LAASFSFSRNFVRLAALTILLAPVVAACSGGGAVGHSGVKRAAFTSKDFGVAVSPRVTKAKFPPRGGGRQMGTKPYVVAGKTYTPIEGPGYIERGRASWYGQDFHGRQTANGEVFGAYYLTAASPVLPIPSYARVTNLENGRSVLVRVNDRGPYLQGRVMDLSYEAARQLGYVDSGHAEVEIRYVGPAPLNGDDTRMLTAAINHKTPMEVEAEQRFGGGYYQSDIAVASASPGLRNATPMFGYAAEAPATGAAAATAALAGGTLAGPEIVNAAGEAITLRLGIFRDAAEADRIGTAFALLGAVDETSATVSGEAASVLTLIRLKPGVTGDDVLALARKLGLHDIVLY
jgi:rare lipoprotein A